MTIDASDTIHRGEIWLKSQCMAQEEQLVDNIYSCLEKHNYQNVNPVSHTRSCWQRGNQTVIVSLVDDLWDCATDRSQDTPYLFDRDTTVITDNFLNCPSVYRLYQTPQSFYGIYSYTPSNQNWTPNRDYTFAVNRVDFKRMQVLLQLHQNLGFDSGYVNFNCRAGRQVLTTEQHRQVFIEQANNYSGNQREKTALIELSNLIPIKNHTLEHDMTYNQSWLNVIVETYSSDNVISTSEKIFRCLVTPVPWVAYAGRYTIAKLREIGFDVLDDIVDHSYDPLLEAQHKMSNFAGAAKQTITHVKSIPWSQVKSRCQAAAFHNQILLEEFSRIWAENQLVWLNQLSRDIR